MNKRKCKFIAELILGTALLTAFLLTEPAESKERSVVVETMDTTQVFEECEVLEKRHDFVEFFCNTRYDSNVMFALPVRVREKTQLLIDTGLDQYYWSECFMLHSPKGNEQVICED